jgi:hypothetical protein
MVEWDLEQDQRELDSIMVNFIIAAKKKDGSDYEPTSLRGIISSIDRKLRRHRYGHYIGGHHHLGLRLY